MESKDCTPQKWITNEDNYLKLLKDDNFILKVPLLNVVNLHQLQDKTLVRFRGMVQDMYGPEYYLDQYEVTDKINNKQILKRGKYVDILSEGNEVDFDNPNNITKERHRFVAISVPAVNDWVKKLDEESFHKHSVEIEASSSCKTNKRSAEELDENMDCETSSTTCPSKKHQSVANNKSSSELQHISKEYLLNFPLPDTSGKACHLIIYKDSDSLKLNDVCEFIGFLSVNPLLTETINEDNNDEAMEIQTHHPPSSLIPRIHCVAHKKLEHTNPLHANISNSVDDIRFIRRELQILFTQLLLGDNLAAEYLILHLISKIYLRKDILVLGKFSLNISNIPTGLEEIDFVKELYKFIELLLPKSHYLAMTLENMNTLSFTPKKDYKCNRLTSGVLQLSANTHLILDETKLSNGKLNQAGIDNVKAIANAIKDQKVPYDFNYYRLDYECDIPILIFSEGKSLLSSDFHVVLKPTEEYINTFDEILTAAKHFLQSDLLNKIRIYLTEARMGSYELPDNVENLIENEFVNMRQADNKINADDLHSLLVLARLVCLSYGKTSLDEECWKIACNLEHERKQRLIK